MLLLSQTIFDQAQTYELMHCLEELNMSKKLENVKDNEAVNNAKVIHVLIFCNSYFNGILQHIYLS